jgi:hypothetical protein
MTRAARGSHSGEPFIVQPDEAERFWGKVRKVKGGCWEWQGFRLPTGGHKLGYGQMVVRSLRRPVNTHRIAWVIEHGTIPAGLCVCHRCDNPPCVNPAHLFLGTARDNTRDMIAKGRQGHGSTPRPTCRNGHPWTAENTQAIRDGKYRSCALCQAQKGAMQLKERLEVARATLVPFVPETLEGLTARVGQPRARVLAEQFGLYGQPLRTQTELAQALGLSRERVRQLTAHALKTLGAPQVRNPKMRQPEKATSLRAKLMRSLLVAPVSADDSIAA